LTLPGVRRRNVEQSDQVPVFFLTEAGEIHKCFAERRLQVSLSQKSHGQLYQSCAEWGAASTLRLTVPGVTY